MIVLDGFGRDTTHFPVILSGFGHSSEMAELGVDTGGAWLPQEELRKLRRIKKKLVNQEIIRKDEEKRELVLELSQIFDSINDVEEAAEELAAIVEPFVEKTPETAEALEFQSEMPHINFDALASQVETANKLRQLAKRIEEQRQDEEDAIALLLLMP